MRKRKIIIVVGIIVLFACLNLNPLTEDHNEYSNLRSYIEEKDNDLFKIQETIKILSGMGLEGGNL